MKEGFPEAQWPKSSPEHVRTLKVSSVRVPPLPPLPRPAQSRGFLELTPWIGNIEWNSKCFVSTRLWLCKSMATFEKSHQNKISADRMIYLYAVADLHLSAYQNAFFLFILSSLSPCSGWFLSHSLHLLSLFLCFSYSCFAYYVWFLISCLEVGGRCELQHFLSHVNPKFSRVTELSLVVLILIPRLIQK